MQMMSMWYDTGSHRNILFRLYSQFASCFRVRWVDDRSAGVCLIKARFPWIQIWHARIYESFLCDFLCATGARWYVLDSVFNILCIFVVFRCWITAARWGLGPIIFTLHAPVPTNLVGYWKYSCCDNTVIFRYFDWLPMISRMHLGHRYMKSV